MTPFEQLKTFTIDKLPDLDTVVLGALELFEKAELPDTTVPFRRPLIVGSGNAEATGKILFNASDAVFASESSWEETWKRVPEIDGAVLISASGGKHSVGIAEGLMERGVRAILFTNNPDSTAAQYVAPDDVRVFPRNREPYTYNTSTYLGMILADKGESPKAIRSFIETNLSDRRPEDFAEARAFTFILPPQFSVLREMLRTKFDELFGPKIPGRFFTTEEMKHAKTVVPDDREMFISFGESSGSYGRAGSNINIELPENAGYAAAIAITYYIVGLIQKSHHPYFKENIADYCETGGAAFGEAINPIVD